MTAKSRNNLKKRSFVNHRITAYLLVLTSVRLGVLISSCSRPKEVLGRKDMEKLMYDIYIAEAMIENDYNEFGSPEKKEALIRGVFRKHGITQAQWDTSLSWYSDRIDLYMKMNDSVKARLQRSYMASDELMRRQLQQEQSLTARYYPPSHIPNCYAFDETHPKNGFRFRLDTAEISQRINENEFSFGFEVIGIPASPKPDLRAVLMLEYNDTVVYRYEVVAENREYLLQGEKYLPDDTIRNITGFVRLQDTTGLFRRIRLLNIFLGNPDDSLQQADRFKQIPPVHPREIKGLDPD
mgnify:CR=1 FL=1